MFRIFAPHDVHCYEVGDVDPEARSWSRISIHLNSVQFCEREQKVLASLSLSSFALRRTRIMISTDATTVPES